MKTSAQSVTDNEAKFTKRKDTAQAARDLHKRIGYPPDVKLTMSLKLGTTQNSNVLPADLIQAIITCPGCTVLASSQPSKVAQAKDIQ